MTVLLCPRCLRVPLMCICPPLSKRTGRDAGQHRAAAQKNLSSEIKGEGEIMKLTKELARAVERAETLLRERANLRNTIERAESEIEALKTQISAAISAAAERLTNGGGEDGAARHVAEGQARAAILSSSIPLLWVKMGDSDEALRAAAAALECARSEWNRAVVAEFTLEYRAAALQFGKTARKMAGLLEALGLSSVVVDEVRIADPSPAAMDPAIYAWTLADRWHDDSEASRLHESFSGPRVLAGRLREESIQASRAAADRHAAKVAKAAGIVQ